jgi:hypothetical protein
MRVLLANLRHFYQRRGLWIAYVGLTLVTWFIVQWVLTTPSRENGVFGGFLVCSFLWGLLMATTQMETASKPFSFCLPGHRDAVRRLVFLAGFIVSLAFVLIFTALLESSSFLGPSEFYVGSPGMLILLRISYFCASMTAYLLGAGIAFSLIHGGSALGLITLVVALCAMFDVFTPIQYPLLHWPVAVIALALAVGLAGWWWLGRRAWFRRGCDRPWMGLFDPWDRRHAERFRELYATRFIKNIPPAWDRFFQRVIGRRPPSALGKYAWGALYTTCVLVGPQWKGILALALAWLAFAGYFPAAAPMIMGFLPLMTVGFLQSPLGTALLVAGGRKERFFATVVLILGFSMAWVLLFGVLVGLTHLLAPVVPAVTVRGDTLSLHAISFQVVWIPLVLVPLVGLVQTLFCRKPVALALSIMLLVAIMMVSSTPLGLYRAVTPALAIAGAVLSWGICLLLLHRIAMHRDLVRQ